MCTVGGDGTHLVGRTVWRYAVGQRTGWLMLQVMNGHRIHNFTGAIQHPPDFGSQLYGVASHRAPV